MRAEELKYSKDHVWVMVEEGLARLGITEHAQRELGEVVFLELPELKRTCSQGEIIGSIESVKTTNDLFCPLSGEVVEVNTLVRDKPDTVNADPLGQGWLFRVRLSDPGQVNGLMDFQAYTAFTQG
jgi:glycine cleavage system H protein